MEKIYDELIEFIVSSGKRIAQRAGHIDDIGVKKQYVTEEDIAIEKGMEEIIKKNHPTHEFFAEEEHDSFHENEDVWVADPISGTKTFIQGLPHYGIAIAHTKNKVTQFGAVYDPSADELFVAYKGKGAFLNGNRIFVSNEAKKVIFNLSSGWKDEKSGQEMLKKLEQFEMSRNQNSHAVNLCHVACGRYDGAMCFGKDSFPIFAGGIIIQEAGGIFTNKEDRSNFDHGDRVFAGGNKIMYEKLREALHQVKINE